MKTVAIVFHSGYGNTAKVAAAVAEGAHAVAGVTVRLLALTPEQITAGRWQDDALMAELSAADAIIFGAPTYMGMVSGVFKCFADATAGIWFQMGWKDKIAGGFTSSAYTSGDKVMTLHYLATLAAQLRMVWVGPAAPPSNLTGDEQDLDRNGYYIGIGAVGNVREDLGLPSAGDLRTAALYGQRIAEVTLRWQAAPLNA
ncbi:MAG: flavodoxin family protein [Chloroflexi bacterium]|nr:flavodoxin family protein [Chloroflexota bacterium]